MTLKDNKIKQEVYCKYKRSRSTRIYIDTEKN